MAQPNILKLKPTDFRGYIINVQIDIYGILVGESKLIRLVELVAILKQL